MCLFCPAETLCMVRCIWQACTHPWSGPQPNPAGVCEGHCYASLYLACCPWCSWSAKLQTRLKHRAGTSKCSVEAPGKNRKSISQTVQKTIVSFSEELEEGMMKPLFHSDQHFPTTVSISQTHLCELRQVRSKNRTSTTLTFNHYLQIHQCTKKCAKGQIWHASAP